MANYGTVAGFKAYVDARGGSYAGKSDAEITAALVRATTYIDATYRASFLGYKTDRRDQELEWPRTNAWDAAGEELATDEVPVEIENATYEGAIRELATPGSLDPDVKAGGGVIKRVKAGSVEVEYASTGTVQATYRRIDGILAGLFGAISPYSGVVTRA